MKDKILDYIFPPNGRCPLCQKVLFFTQEFVCYDCFNNLERIQGNRCKLCNKEIHWENRLYCSDCLQYDYKYVQGYSIYNYEGNIQKLIYEIKYNNNPSLCIYLGQILAKELISCTWFSKIQIIIPVPLHKNRITERGYNQANKICEGIYLYLNKTQYKNIPIFMDEVLLRNKDTIQQITLTKVDRFKNTKSAFEIKNNINIKDKFVLLIDDVYTTGATINSCTCKLLKNGAKEVYFATVAIGK